MNQTKNTHTLTPDIQNLIPDIYSLIKRKDGWFDEQLATIFSQDVGRKLVGQLGDKGSRKPSLRLSKMGKRCPCALWHSINNHTGAEALPAWAEIKFAYGHIFESLSIALAKAAGHEVTGEQTELTLDGITGHRDCVIDGCVVDVKSAASRSFTNFKTREFSPETDTFGYLDQLDGYILASREDPLVREKTKGYLLAIDKQLGHMCLYEHEVTDERARTLRERIEYHKRVVEYPSPPPCECKTIPVGASGNVGLDLKGSYEAYKYCCFPQLRTFLYAGGPVYLTTVVKRPKRQDGSFITEVDRYGQIVYH